MDNAPPKSSFWTIYVLPALLLFVVPLCAYAFAQHATDSYNEDFSQWLSDQVTAQVASEGEGEVTAEQRQDIEAGIRAMPTASSVCLAGEGGSESASPLREMLHEDLCDSFWQFDLARLISMGSIVLGLVSALFAVVCSGIARRSRALQYGSFVAGWWFLRIASTVQVLVQGALLVWLSYWTLALWVEVIVPKLILLLGILTASVAFYAVKSIFARPDLSTSVQGELLPRSRAPKLWQRVEQLCASLETQPPEQIIVGIDENFFVTETCVDVSDTKVNGRSLYASLSLLRVLSCSEADAILAHEMAHFSGGDTEYSQRFAPKLASFENYLEAVALAVPVFMFMRAYHALFTLSIQKHARQREFRADELSAKLVSPEALAHSLIKVSGYASYRERVHDELLEHDEVHQDLGIAERVSNGIAEYAHSAFTEDLSELEVPHPFDSHPLLAERIEAVGVKLESSSYPAVLLQQSDSWYGEIDGAKEIEAELWSQFEDQMSRLHEIVLAHRYLPDTPEQAALVEKHFPSRSFAFKKDKPPVEISHGEIRWHKWDEPLQVRNIKKVQWVEQYTAHDLHLTLHEPMGKKKKLKLSFRGLQDQDGFKETVERYVERCQTALAYHEQVQSELPQDEQQASA